jgi:hypothetical protein
LPPEISAMPGVPAGVTAIEYESCACVPNSRSHVMSETPTDTPRTCGLLPVLSMTATPGALLVISNGKFVIDGFAGRPAHPIGALCPTATVSGFGLT